MNIAPGPNGDYDAIVYDRLKEISGWMDQNHSAVFATRSVAPYHEGDFYYTQTKDGNTLNVFHLDEKSDYQAPAELIFTLPEQFKPKSLNVLGLSKVHWKQSGNTVKVQLYEDRKNLKYAAVIQLKQ
jgi:alpha-L-fucosidase